MRLSYFNNGTSAEVLEENNFYPFGLKHEGYNAQAGNPAYNYQYNGKELQKETGWSDYSARMYMSDIVRWGVIDPLAEQYRRLTPYNSVANNPINFIDPDGRKMMTPKGSSDSQPPAMTLGGMMDYYANGGRGSTSDVLKFLGQEDMLGNFYNLAIFGASGGGSATSGMNFTDPKAIAVLQQYFANPNNTVSGLFSMIKQITSFKEQLDKSNFKSGDKFKFKDENVNGVINSVKEIKMLYPDVHLSINDIFATKKLFDHHGLPASAGTVMQEDGKFNIYLSTKFINTNLDFAFGIFHEFGHILNEQGMSFSEWTKYVNSPSIFKEEISVWKNFNYPAGDPNATKAIKFYENLLNNQRK